MNRDTTLPFTSVLASSIHDMKNSLGMLITSIDEVAGRAEGRDPEVADEMYRLQREAKRVNNNLVQLLTHYRMGQGEYVPQMLEHSVAEFLEEAVAEFEALFAHRGIQVSVDCPEELTWVFDEGLLMGVMRNVLNNLVKYTRDRVLLRAFSDAGWLAVDVEDNGPGFPEAILALPGQMAREVDIRGSSTGLGLYFSAEAARCHQHQGRRGHIELANHGVLGGGSFRVRLP